MIPAELYSFLHFTHRTLWHYWSKEDKAVKVTICYGQAFHCGAVDDGYCSQITHFVC